MGRQGPGFVLGVSSPSPRAVETADAMGFPPHRKEPPWGDPSAGRVLEREWPQPRWRAGELARTRGGLSERADRLVRPVEGTAGPLPPGVQPLVVTHGGFPEPLLTRAFPERDAREWEGVPRCMEGVVLSHLDGPPSLPEVLRVPDHGTRV